MNAQGTRTRPEQPPLIFVPNSTPDSGVLFTATASGAQFLFRQDDAALMFQKADRPRQGLALILTFPGSSPQRRVEAASETSGRFNVLRGNDPSKWVRHVPTFERLVYRDRWPGIDLFFQGDAGALRYELDARPGANLSAVRIAIHGARSVSLDKAGTLNIATEFGAMVGTRPVGLAVMGGKRVAVEARYVLQKDSAVSLPAIGFRAAERPDAHHPLVIEAGLVYSNLGATPPRVRGDRAPAARDPAN